MTVITTIGRLGRDVELKHSSSGTPYVNFSIATTQGFGDKSKTLWFECTAFGSDAQRLSKAKTKKGSLLQVTGELGTTEFERKDKTKGYSLTITNARWAYVPGSSKGNVSEKNDADEAPELEILETANNVGEAGDEINLDDDELPF
ncbi:MAG: single-stranded DNA-binding protein [Defluviitaleaceae bacterium]|nr:single-stranded DNA-binding protein [Defluviitaleaceae bacterium]